MSSRCPALLICAPASGQGKTLVTAALARHHTRQGLQVQVFKTGPDFLDPMVLEQASGHPVYQLDLFMGGQEHCRYLLAQAARNADLILIEGVMGLFDGQPCSADLAALFGIPILAVIDASAMAQTFGAMAHGLATYRQDLPFAGVIANRVAGPGHAQMLRDSLPPPLRWFGWLPSNAGFELPERYLGLVQAQDIHDLDDRINAAAAALAIDPVQLHAEVEFDSVAPPAITPLLHGKTIGIAKDAAFSFIYPANIKTLEQLGAQCVYFSPLTDPQLPVCDALWLPGGYPELHLEALSANQAMHRAIRTHHAAGKPILAECGGMLYVGQSLAANNQQPKPCVGLLPAYGTLQTRLVAIGLQRVESAEGPLRGHTFHYSTLQTSMEPVALASNPNGGLGEAVYRLGSLTASYIHFYFASNPTTIARMFSLSVNDTMS